jgi:hypothetical protein
MHDPDPVVETLSELRHGLPALAAGRGWQAEQTLHRRAALCPLGQCIEQGVRGILSTAATNRTAKWRMCERKFGIDNRLN